MAIQVAASPLSIASNKIVSIGKRSGNALPTMTKDYDNFALFLDLKLSEIQAVGSPSAKTLKEISSINVANSMGTTGGLLSSVLSGGLDLAGFITGKESKAKGGKAKGKPSPKMAGNKLKLGGLRSVGVVNAIFAGLDFATGLAEGESVGKAAAGAGGSLAGSLLGGAIGQALIPVPGLGFVVGSSIGSFIGGYTADRAADAIEGIGKQKPTDSSLRRELDVKIQEKSKEQASMVESKSGKAFKTSVNKFSKSVDVFGDFFKMGGFSFNAPTDEMYDIEAPPSPQPPNPPGEAGDGEMVVEGGELPSKYLSPAAGATYGSRGGKHKGVDYAFSFTAGTPVSVIKPGIVTLARWVKEGFGNAVYILHEDGIESIYGHLQTIKVKEGQRIAPGTVIGTEGSTGRSTGPHVHFELRRGNVAIPIGPEKGDEYFRYGGKVIVTPRTQSQTSPAGTGKDFVLEVHSVGPDEKKRSGLIASYIHPPTPASSALVAEFGSYSRTFREGNLGGPRRGLNLIETDMRRGVRENAIRLLKIIKNTPGQHFHLFAGHADVTTGETGTTTDGVLERDYTREVCEMIEQMARAQGIKNVTYHRSIISNELGTGKSNWERGEQILRRSSTSNQTTSPFIPSPSNTRYKLSLPGQSPMADRISQFTPRNRHRSQSATIIDRNVNNIIMVGNKDGGSAKPPVVMSVPSGGGGGVVSYGPTPNQLRDSIAEFILLSSIA